VVPFQTSVKSGRDGIVMGVLVGTEELVAVVEVVVAVEVKLLSLQ